MNTLTRLHNHALVRVTTRQLQHGHFSVCLRTAEKPSFTQLVDALYDCSHGKCYMSSTITDARFPFSDNGHPVGEHAIICKKSSGFSHPLAVLKHARLSPPTPKISLCFAAWCQDAWKDKTIIFPHEPVMVDTAPCILTLVGTNSARYVLLVDTHFEWREAFFGGDVYVAGYK